MSRKSASLLTKTQRRRLRNHFEELTESKKRRDQQRIRNRLQAGTLDFQLLAGFPDKQLELAFDDVSDEELRQALADAYLTIERIRKLREYDRDDLIKTACARGDEYTADGDDLRSLDELELRTEAEVRAAAETETERRLTGSRWTKYANAVMALGAIGFLLASLFWSLDQLFGTRIWADNDVLAAIVFLLMFLGLSGWTLIMGANVLKHNVAPYVRRVLDKKLLS